MCAASPTHEQRASASSTRYPGTKLPNASVKPSKPPAASAISTDTTNAIKTVLTVSPPPRRPVGDADAA